MSCGGFGSPSDERTTPLLEQVVGQRTSSGRGVATILSLAESRAISLERARAAFRIVTRVIFTILKSSDFQRLSSFMYLRK